MGRWWHVFRFEVLSQGRRRAYLFTTFGIPLIAVALVFAIPFIQERLASGGEEADTTEADTDVYLFGYVDESGLFPSPGRFGTALSRYDSEDAALEAMAAGEIDGVFVIPADYLETGEVTRYTDTFSLGRFNAENIFRSFLLQSLLRGAEVDPNLLLRLQSDLSLVEHRVDRAGQASIAQHEDASYTLVYLFGLLLVLATFFSGGYLMRSVIEEKETRMVEIIISTMRPLPLLAGKVLAAGLLGLIQIVVWVVAAIIVLDRIGGIIPVLLGVTMPPGMAPWLILYFLLGYLFIAGVYAAIGAVSNSMREGPQYAVLVTLPAMIPFYFATVFAETPNSALAVILSLFPLTAPLAMVQRLAVAEVPLVELLVSVGLLVLAAVGSIWLAGRLFRVNTLLAGQTPRLRDLVRIVRED